MGKILTVILLTLTCGCLAGCQDVGDVQYYGSKASDQRNEKSEILLVERSTNYAWGHYDRGTFVDTE